MQTLNDAWAAKRIEYTNKAPKIVVLVAHSAGTSPVMKWSFNQPAALWNGRVRYDFTGGNRYNFGG